MNNALLVVDIQNYYLPSSPEDLPQRIADHYRSVNYDVIAFSAFKNNLESNFVRSLKWNKCDTKDDSLLPDEFADLAQKDNVFTRAAYSAFKTTDLHDYLRKQGVERLVICGADSDACVLATAFEAFDLGYHVKVNFDLSFSSGNLQEAARKIVERSILSRD